MKKGKNVHIGEGTVIHDNVEIGDNVIIGEYCVIGAPSSPKYYDNKEEYESEATKIGSNSFIRPFTLISEGVEIGEHFQCGDKVMMRKGTKIGHHSSVGTLCDLQGKLEIGNYVRLHSNVHLGMLTKIEDYVWIYPFVVATNDPNPPMGNLIGVTIKEFAQIATGSILFPGVTIGRNAFIGACSVVRKSVDDERVVAGVPAIDRCSVRELKDVNGEPYLPWKEHLKENRGYPWQTQEEK